MSWLTQILSAMARPFQWWIIVAPWENALRVRLGRVAAVLPPGIHFRIPFLDRIYVQSVRLRIVTSSGQTVSTKDGKALSYGMAVRFAIDDVLLLYQSVSNPETTLMGAVASWAAEHIAVTDSAKLTPRNLEDYVNGQAHRLTWGLRDLAVNVTSFAYARTYRLMLYEYERLTGMDLDGENTGQR